MGFSTVSPPMPESKIPIIFVRGYFARRSSQSG